MTRFRAPAALAASLAALSAAGAQAGNTPVQPALGAHHKAVIHVDGLAFRDLDGDGKLTPYEDWRLSPEARATDLVQRMTLEEKAGTLMFGSAPGEGGGFNPAAKGYDLALSRQAIDGRKVTSLITRLNLPPSAMAEQANGLQDIAENTRLGIPLVIGADPRNHFGTMIGASAKANGVTLWPDLPGLAAIGDSALVREMGLIISDEYRAVGLQVALSPQLDVASEPRWSRIDGTFGSDPATISRLGGAYVAGFQHDAHGLAQGGVMTVVKHWVGYGAEPEGFDAHNHYGRFVNHTQASFAAHVDAFRGALDAGAAGVMPMYPILRGVTVDGKPVEPTGAGYSHVLLTDLLRGTFGYKGVILSDWAITNDCTPGCRAPTEQHPQGFGDIATSWGVEDLSQEDRFAKGMDAGLDQFGGVEDPAPLVAAVQDGKVSMARIDASVVRVLVPRFRMGLFENPYVDPAEAARVAGDPAAHALADATQRRAQVLLENAGNLIPLAPQARKVWLFGVDPDAARAAGLEVVDKPEQADVAIIRAQTPHEVLHPWHFFGSRQHEGRLDFRPGDPAFDAAVKASNAHVPVVFAPFMDRPAILTAIRPYTRAILANFGASDAAVLDVVTGKARAEGRLPFELPRSMEAVAAQDPAVSDDSKDPLYPRGAGIVAKP